jgi:guanylate kinase
MSGSGTIFIISAPSGAGKTTLVNTVLQQLDNLVVSVSHTTRPRRHLEEHEQHYYFVAPEIFNKMLSQDEFVEYAEVFGYYYGTSKQVIANAIQQQQDLILEIDWQGARQIRQSFPDNTVSIFILPPNLTTLQQRLLDRNQDKPEIIAARMAQAAANIAHYRDYNYVIINNDFAHAVADLVAIIRAQRLNLKCNIATISTYIEQLLHGGDPLG